MVIFFDTESIGFYGPTLLIQYAKDEGPVYLHHVFDERVIDTLALIEKMMEHPIVGFNLTHDMYHLNRTYNILKELPLASIPNPIDYRDVESEAPCSYCVKPITALDLMVWGRKNEFQSTLNQKDITIRRVPKVLAEELVSELTKRVKIPDIYFSRSQVGYHWRIIELDADSKGEIAPLDKEERNIDPNFVNIKLQFNPSTALKVIMEKVLGHDVTTLDDLPQLKKPEEHGWWPSFGAWSSVFNEHMFHWKNDPRRLKYAEDDVKYTRELYHHFGDPSCGDTDSVLACSIGAIYWRGYEFDKDRARARLANEENVFSLAGCNVNSPKQVKQYLWEVCDELERLAIPDTKSETLKAIVDWDKSLSNGGDTNEEAAKRAKEVLDARRAAKEIDLLNKLLIAGKMYATYKVIGTKSNRMSGGSESYLKRGGSINPQGIKKGDTIREILTLAGSDMDLSGGDFSGFEIAIAAAVYNDLALTELLLEGKKFHGLFGAEMYEMTYEDIMLTESKGENEYDGYYARAKRAVFAWLYGAQLPKLATVLWLEEDEIFERMRNLERRYPGIASARQKIYENFSALNQKGGIGTAIEWKEPSKYAESFLGFRRYFDMEFSVCRALFEMAQDPSERLKSLGSGIKVQRRDRVQTAGGATASALYASAFNIQAQIMRAAANHYIQSPGGEITKEVQCAIWELQDTGCEPWVVMPMNIHDEVQCPHKSEYKDIIKATVDHKVESYRDRVPLIKMKWKTNLKSWGEK